MGNDQQKAKKEEQKPEDKGKSGLFQISASDGMGLARLNEKIFKNDDPIEELEEFEEKYVVFWGKTDVLEFLNQIDFEDLFTYLDKVEKGEDLVELHFDDQLFAKYSEDLLNREKRRLKIFFVYLLHLKNCQNPKPNDKEENPKRRCFTLKFHRVFRKILKVIGNYDFEVERMESLVCSLCYHEEIERIFLKDEMSKPSEVEEKRKTISMMDEEEGEVPSKDVVKAKSNIEVKLILKEPLEIDLRDQLLKLLDTSSSTTIEALCEEIHKPLVFHKRPNYGYLSPALFLPPFLFEWSQEGLIIPRRIQNLDESVYKIVFDTNPVTIPFQPGNDTKTKIAKTIERWNHYHHFSFQKVSELVTQLIKDEVASEFEKKQKRSTPEEFVTYLGTQLGLFSSSSLEGTGGESIGGKAPVIKNFLDRITKTGDRVQKDGFVFESSLEFEKEYRLEEYLTSSSLKWERYVENQGVIIRFLSHAELDDFVRYCIEVGEKKGEKKFVDEFRLLKSFDRVFWMRRVHIFEDDDENWKPSSKGCPFSSPVE